MDDHAAVGMAAERQSGQRRLGSNEGVTVKVCGDGGRTEVGTSGASLHHLFPVGAQEHGPITEGVCVVENGVEPVSAPVHHTDAVTHATTDEMFHTRVWVLTTPTCNGSSIRESSWLTANLL